MKKDKEYYRIEAKRLEAMPNGTWFKSPMNTYLQVSMSRYIDYYVGITESLSMAQNALCDGLQVEVYFNDRVYSFPRKN